ncbi:MAG: hypothetical protein PHT53_08015 [Candidatus Omnitrophica bacterium]|nr:hypothetical protein [Candidatus Omnitrophota bacterium]
MMNYIIFDNDIYYDKAGKTGFCAREKMGSVFSANEEFSVAIIDTLQKQQVAPEKPISKRDEVLASSFTGEYVTQSERISPNLFQVIAAEKPKIAEIYKHLGFENVKLLVPYGIALREFLKSNGLFSQGKKIVFLDHQENQVLLTIFNNDLFTTPRRLQITVKRLTPEIIRSEENYKALNKDKEEITFLIATNSKEIADEIISSGIEVKENVFCLSESYPALTGLRQGSFSLHYLLPEHFIRLRKQALLKKRVFSFGIIAVVLGILLTLFFASGKTNKNALAREEELRSKVVSANKTLEESYSVKYKDILKEKSKLNLSYFVDSFIGNLPEGYSFESISIIDIAGGYKLEAIVLQKTMFKSFTKLVLPSAFKTANQENILVKGVPGVRVTLDIY